MESKRMVTLETMEQLFDTKLARLENRIIKGLKDIDSVDNTNTIPNTALLHTPPINVTTLHDELSEVLRQVNCSQNKKIY